MKEITKERRISYSVWQAADGTEFDSKEECELYDKSALGVMRAKIAKMIVYDTRKEVGVDAWSIMGGTDDHDIVAIKMEHPEDLDTVKQWFLLEHPYYENPIHKENKESIFHTMDVAYNKEDILIFGINCDGESYFINSRDNIYKNLSRLYRKEEGNG